MSHTNTAEFISRLIRPADYPTDFPMIYSDGRNGWWVCEEHINTCEAAGWKRTSRWSGAGCYMWPQT